MKKPSSFLLINADPAVTAFVEARLPATGRKADVLNAPGVALNWLRLLNLGGAIVNFHLPLTDSTSLVAQIQAEHPGMPVILVGGLSAKRTVLETAATRAGTNYFHINDDPNTVEEMLRTAVAGFLK